MKSLTTKLVLSAVGVVLVAGPALAQRTRHVPQQPQSYYGAKDPGTAGTYPNGASRTGSEESRESGAEFNVIR